MITISLITLISLIIIMVMPFLERDIREPTFDDVSNKALNFSGDITIAGEKIKSAIKEFLVTNKSELREKVCKELLEIKIDDVADLGYVQKVFNDGEFCTDKEYSSIKESYANLKDAILSKNKNFVKDLNRARYLVRCDGIILSMILFTVGYYLLLPFSHGDLSGCLLPPIGVMILEPFVCILGIVYGLFLQDNVENKIKAKYYNAPVTPTTSSGSFVAGFASYYALKHFFE